jgi:hypothetical protein
VETLHEKERGDLDYYMKNPLSFRLPFQLAMLISPIALLIPLHLARKNTWARENLLRVCYSILSDISQLIWQLVIPCTWKPEAIDASQY